MLYESVLSNDENDIRHLLFWDEETIPRELRMFIVLKNTIYLYGRVLELFTEDTQEVLKLRAEGVTTEAIAEKLNFSVTYVTKRITTGYELIDEKTEELLGLIYRN